MKVSIFRWGRISYIRFRRLLILKELKLNFDHKFNWDHQQCKHTVTLRLSLFLDLICIAKDAAVRPRTRTSTVAGCPGAGNDRTFHRFPLKSKTVCAEWVKRCDDRKLFSVEKLSWFANKKYIFLFFIWVLIEIVS